MSTPPFDPTRAADLYRQYAGRLYLRFCREFAGTDPETIADAVVEAILAVAAAPDPVTERQVVYKALGFLQTVRRSDTRRRARENIFSSVVTKSASAAPSILEEPADHELARRYRDRIAHTDHERKALDLWLDGCKNVDELAVRIGSSVAETKTLLHRLRQRIARARSGVRAEGA